MKHIDITEFCELAKDLQRPWHDSYYAMYSSVYGGIVTDPVLMMLPLDDHMVHRGDGVFEAFKCVNGSIYNLIAHVKRMEKSALSLSHQLPYSIEEIQDIVAETVRAGKHKDAMVRMYLSRGSGSYGVNPYDCPKGNLYVVSTAINKPFMELHPEGASVKRSETVSNSSYYATMKSCNYLVNVLMKKEAVDESVDFVVGFDENGNMTEGATENMVIVSKDNVLTCPKLDGVLKGTTMIRVFELAEQMVAAGDLSGVEFNDISYDDVTQASEMLILGTTLNVTMVREFDGQQVNGGQAGPVFKRLSELFLNDLTSNSELLTDVFTV